MILIVDDKPENLFSLKSLLQLHAYEVDTASSGEEALKKILKTEYALIILDVQMPEMDGYEVAETITGYSKTKNIPVIFLSAVNIDKRFITKGYAAGGVDYVTKPFDPDLLLLKVRTFYRLYLQTQELKQDAVKIRQQIDVLFEDTPITEAEVSSLKDGFKVLKAFAQVNIRFRQAREQAEGARRTLDQALQDQNSSDRPQNGKH